MKFFSLQFFLITLLLTGNICLSQTPVRVDIDLTKPTKPVSPFIYGKNNVVESDLTKTGAMDEITRAKQAGIRLVRQGGGNNSTKYNWSLKLSSHPDWYNNVYANDWDIAAKNMLDKTSRSSGNVVISTTGQSGCKYKQQFY